MCPGTWNIRCGVRFQAPGRLFFHASGLFCGLFCSLFYRLFYGIFTAFSWRGFFFSSLCPR